jgi:tetratricopeptide (TPR) repeat protein
MEPANVFLLLKLQRVVKLKVALHFALVRGPITGAVGVSDDNSRLALLEDMYEQYLSDQDSAAFIKNVSLRYTCGTLERLVEQGPRPVRRAAALAIGMLGGYESNAALGRALLDRDRGVRTLAENGMRALWCRAGNEEQRRQLSIVIRLNTSQQFDEAIVLATELIEEAPWFAEAWNQRAIACFCAGRYADSIRDCHQALEINPYHFGAVAGIGQCYLHLGNRESALESFRRALSLNPDLAGVRAQVQHLERVLNRGK